MANHISTKDTEFSKQNDMKIWGIELRRNFLEHQNSSLWCHMLTLEKNVNSDEKEIYLNYCFLSKRITGKIPIRICL
jgi:hypothetical protein